MGNLLAIYKCQTGYPKKSKISIYKNPQTKKLQEHIVLYYKEMKRKKAIHSTNKYSYKKAKGY